jgi:hypothetical protein
MYEKEYAIKAAIILDLEVGDGLPEVVVFLRSVWGVEAGIDRGGR